MSCAEDNYQLDLRKLPVVCRNGLNTAFSRIAANRGRKAMMLSNASMAHGYLCALLDAGLLTSDQFCRWADRIDAQCSHLMSRPVALEGDHS